MKKLLNKSRICLASILFALIISLGGGVACLSYNNRNTHSQVNSTQLGYTMPSTFTGNYVVSGGKVYAETTEDNQDSVADDDETNTATLTSTASSHGGPDTFGFSQNGSLNITFLKDDYTNNTGKVNFASFASAKNTEVASTLSATYNNGTVEMVVTDNSGEVQIETSGDACYTLGELVTGTSQTLNVDNCVFRLGSSDQTQTTNNMYTASLTSTATLTTATTEKVAQILNLKSGKFTLNGGNNRKTYKPFNPTGNDNDYLPGKAIYAVENSSLTIKNLNLLNFSTSSFAGAAVYFEGQNLSVQNCDISECSSSSMGAAIYSCTDGDATISNCTFDHNSANSDGGAIYAEQTTLLLEDCTFKYNSARCGSALHICDSSSSLEVNGCTFQYNYNSGTNGNSVVYVEEISYCNMNNTNFLDNGDDSANYGALYLDNTESYIKGCTFEHNNSKYGGAVYSHKGGYTTSTFVNCEFINNYSSNVGGAVYLENDSDNDESGNYHYHYNFYECTFEDNTATTNGGALWAEYCYLNLRSCKFTDNDADGDYGGALYIKARDNAADGQMKVSISGENTLFSSNTSTRGGGIYNGGDLIINDATFEENIAKVHGGAIYCANVVGTTTINGGEFKNNQAANNGGAICSDQALTITGASFTNNSTKIKGGAISIGKSFSLTNANFEKNSSEIGGAINLLGSLTAEITSTQFYNNSSTSNGGAIYCDGSTLNLNSGIFIANNAGGHAGAIYNTGTLNLKNGTIRGNTSSHWAGGILSTGTFNMTDGGILQNSATEHGGGLFIEGGTATISGGSISKNKTINNHGGGIYLHYGTLNISGGSISQNTSTDCGGGIYSQAALTITGGTIDGNTCSGYGGGGVYAQAGTVNISSGTISNNISLQQGGGIMSQVSMTITGGTFSSNTAAGDGGGVYFLNGGSIANATVYNNKASWGAGVIVRNKPVDLLSGTIINGNRASKNSAGSGGVGGGLFVYDSATANIKGAVIGNSSATSAATALAYSNYAEDGGAGVEIWSGSTVNLSSGTIAYNYAASQGGGIRNLGTLNVTGGTIARNTADNCGGVYSSGTFALSGGSIINNKANTSAVKNIRIVGGTFNINGNATISTSETNKTNIYIENGTFNLNSNFTSTVGSGTACIELSSTKYINVNTTLTKNYSVWKAGITSIDDGDTSSCYIAYSTNSTYKNSALNHLKVSNMPTGRELYTSDSSNYVYVRIQRLTLDLNIYVDDELINTSDYGVFAGFKVGGVDNGYLFDYYNTQVLYGTTFQVYGIKNTTSNHYTYSYSNRVGTSHSGNGSGTVTANTTVEVRFTSYYIVTITVDNFEHGYLNSEYNAGNNGVSTIVVSHIIKGDFPEIYVDSTNAISFYYNREAIPVAREGYEFAGWENISGPVDADRTITATFRKTHSITITNISIVGSIRIKDTSGNVVQTITSNGTYTLTAGYTATVTLNGSRSKYAAIDADGTTIYGSLQVWEVNGSSYKTATTPVLRGTATSATSSTEFTRTISANETWKFTTSSITF